jgi:hypothetical protein
MIIEDGADDGTDDGKDDGDVGEIWTFAEKDPSAIEIRFRKGKMP